MKQLILAVALAFIEFSAHAHGGGVDADGCHKKGQAKHCHSGVGVNAVELNKLRDGDKERRAAHKINCRGVAGVKNSQPKYDNMGQLCKSSEAAR